MESLSSPGCGKPATPLSAEDIDAARAYAERVWHGLERAPIRPIDAERFGRPPSDAGGSRDS
jgi:hypothetical protein